MEYQKIIINRIITEIFSENNIEYVIIKDDTSEQLYTHPLSEFIKIRRRCSLLKIIFNCT